MKIFKFFLFLSLLIFILLSYLGFVPFVSDLIGSTQARDLGKTFSQENYDKAYEKANLEQHALKDSDYPYSIKYEDSHPADVYFSDDEITALVNQNNYRDFPITNAQVKIHPDGTTEASGIFSTPKLIQYLTSLGVPLSDINQAMETYPIPQKDLPFYMKGQVSVTNNNINLNFANLELGRIPVPTNIINKYQEPLVNFIENKVAELVPQAQMQEVSLKNGQLHYVGTLPDKEYTTRK